MNQRLEQAWECKIPPSGPSITDDDLAEFFHGHFSEEAIANFGSTFVNPANFFQSHDSVDINDAGAAEEEEDDLGYYEDGVRRTLTDGEIEFFRQSELRELRRRELGLDAHQKAATPREGISYDGAGETPPQQQQESTSQQSAMRRGSSKAKKRKGGKNVRHEPKPDLRKRTWDVVEKGLDTLDYD
ncbi:hypothetical protein RJ55_07169 [Drechmeria coniospora]|nr:hypothetical protein RJ55_07169 [Drechmeria coniospora]